MAATMSKQERDQRQTLATTLEHFVAQGVLTLLIIVRRIKLSRASGLAHIAALHTFEKIVGDLLEIWPGEKKDTLVLMHLAKLGGVEGGDKLIVEELLKRISDEDLAKLFERWMSTDLEVTHRLTFEQFAHAFSPAELSACVRHGLTMVGILPPEASQTAEDAVSDAPPAGTDAPEATVIEEDVDDEPPTTDKPTTDKPTDGSDGK